MKALGELLTGLRRVCGAFPDKRRGGEPWPQLRLRTRPYGSVWWTWQWAQVWQELSAWAQPPLGQQVGQARPTVSLPARPRFDIPPRKPFQSC